MTSISVILTLSGSIVGAYVAIIGVYKFIAGHIGDKDKHPCSDDVVYSDVWEEREKANTMEHQHLKEGIDAAIARSDEQHVELKKNMQDGFTEIKTLIRSIK